MEVAGLAEEGRLWRPFCLSVLESGGVAEVNGAKFVAEVETKCGVEEGAKCGAEEGGAETGGGGGGVEEGAEEEEGAEAEAAAEEEVEDGDCEESTVIDLTNSFPRRSSPKLS